MVEFAGERPLGGCSSEGEDLRGRWRPETMAGGCKEAIVYDVLRVDNDEMLMGC